jgi:hypothetical protein
MHQTLLNTPQLYLLLLKGFDNLTLRLLIRMLRFLLSKIADQDSLSLVFRSIHSINQLGFPMCSDQG